MPAAVSLAKKYSGRPLMVTCVILLSSWVMVASVPVTTGARGAAEPSATTYGRPLREAPVGARALAAVLGVLGEVVDGEAALVRAQVVLGALAGDQDVGEVMIRLGLDDGAPGRGAGRSHAGRSRGRGRRRMTGLAARRAFG